MKNFILSIMSGDFVILSSAFFAERRIFLAFASDFLFCKKYRTQNDSSMGLSRVFPKMNPELRGAFLATKQSQPFYAAIASLKNRLWQKTPRNDMFWYLRTDTKSYDGTNTF